MSDQPVEAVTRLINVLSGEKADVKAAKSRVAALAASGALSPIDTLAMLAAAGRRYYGIDAYTEQGRKGDLVKLALSAPTDERHVAAINELLAAFGRDAQIAVSAWLVTRGADGARDLLHLLRDHGLLEEPAASVCWFLRGFGESREALKVLVPALFNVALAADAARTVDLAVLGWLQKGRIRPSALRSVKASIVNRFTAARAAQREREESGIRGWRFAKTYDEVRRPAALLVDLLAHIPCAESLSAMRDAVRSADPMIAAFAVRGLLIAAVEPTRSDLLRIAGDPEARSHLYGFLEDRNRLDLMPRKFTTQAALAEAQMATWLSYPTELGSPPAAIEMMATVESAASRQRFYLFRFKARAPHSAAKKGWMSGIAGAYDTSAAPRVHARDTWSSFEKWTASTPDECADDLASKKGGTWVVRLVRQGRR